MGALSGKVVVVTGASRGIGKGTALTLAGEGATVYVTGRTVEAGVAPLPGTVGETAAECDARAKDSGGKGIPVQCDVTDDAQLAALFDQVQREQGRLDILVNNVLSIPPEMTQRLPFWDKPLSNWEIFDTGLRAAFIASYHAAKIMVPQRSGLIVGLSGFVGVTYTYDVIFGTTKTAMDRMMRDMAIELKEHGICALSLWQGFTYTERAIANLKNVPGMVTQLNSAAGSSPEYPGRIIAALATDAEVMKRSGGTWINAELGAEYGVSDVDGRMIPSNRLERGSPIWGAI
jgi:NAD(P)-dependent dehydrogenase (short-subunit alcohol dehydrogenase family)